MLNENTYKMVNFNHNLKLIIMIFLIYKALYFQEEEFKKYLEM